MAEYSNKVEGHRGDAARLEQMARDLLNVFRTMDRTAAILQEQAQAHWAAAQDAAFATYEVAEPEVVAI